MQTWPQTTIEINIFGYDSVFSDQSWSIENSLKTFPCEYCDKVFKAKNSYYNHVNIHKGKTFCVVCNKHLSTVSNLKAHMAQKHGHHESIWFVANFRCSLGYCMAKQQGNIFLWDLFQVLFEQKVTSKSFRHSQGKNNMPSLQHSILNNL